MLHKHIALTKFARHILVGARDPCTLLPISTVSEKLYRIFCTLYRVRCCI